MKHILILLILILAISPAFSQKYNFDHSLFDRLLKENVNNEGLVDYEAFVNNKYFDQYIASLETADIDSLPERDKFAFLINAYNALVIKNVIENLPLNSPLDLEGFFDKKKFLVAGEKLTLNQLEYDHVFKIDSVLCHFGLVCAGKSCPVILQKAYSGDDIYEQLEINARDFLNDPVKNKLDKVTNTLYLSEIFKWFKDIFIEKYGSVLSAAAHYINADDSKYIIENEITIKYIPYNWKLNKQ